MNLLHRMIWSIELDAKPLYICMRSHFKNNGEPPDNMQKSSGSPHSADCFRERVLYYVSAFKEKFSFAKNIARHEKLKLLLSDSAKKNVLIPGLAFCDDMYFERGFFVSVKASNGEISGAADYEHKATSEEDTLRKIAKEFGTDQILKFYQSSADDQTSLLMQCLNSQGSANEEFEIIETGAPPIHPAFVTATNSVYHDMARVNDVLDDSSEFEEAVSELRKICGQYISPDAKLPLVAQNPVIVIEGLDATGKTTLTKNLGKLLDATVLKSPPECICHLRSKFDSCSQLLRRAFYSLGNYAFAAMIQEAAKNGIVIVDRFWNSTAAYAIATDVGVGGVDNLPPPGHWVYSWPSDLLRPDAVFLLTITDEERRRRITKRGLVKTDEEIWLEKSRLFGQRLEESYKRMQKPSMQVIDASGTEKEVLDKTTEILKSAGLLDLKN